MKQSFYLRLILFLMAGVLSFSSLLIVRHLPQEPQTYVTNQNEDTVSVINTVINTATNTEIKTIEVGAVNPNPQHVAMTPDGKFAYVANQLDANVSVINTATNTEIKQIDVFLIALLALGLLIALVVTLIKLAKEACRGKKDC